MSGKAHWDGTPFTGAKIVAHLAGELLVYRRDRKPSIPYPGMLDLPGGGREGQESPDDCGLRELSEEFGITLLPARIGFRRAYRLSGDRPPGWLLTVELEPADVAAIRFGDEGEDWQLMPFTHFLAHPEAVDHLKDRVRDYLASTG